MKLKFILWFLKIRKTLYNNCICYLLVERRRNITKIYPRILFCNWTDIDQSCHELRFFEFVQAFVYPREITFSSIIIFHHNDDDTNFIINRIFIYIHSLVETRQGSIFTSLSRSVIFPYQFLIFKINFRWSIQKLKVDMQQSFTLLLS